MKYRLIRIGKFILVLLSLGVCLAGVRWLTNVAAITEEKSLAEPLVLVVGYTLTAAGFIFTYFAIVVWRESNTRKKRQVQVQKSAQSTAELSDNDQGGT